MNRHIPRLYIPDIIKDNDFNIVDSQQVRHMFSVMRIKAGDKIIIFNEIIGEFLTEIIEIDKKHIKLACKALLRKPTIRNNKLCIAFGIIKNTPLIWMLEKLTELGVTDLYPLITDYTNISNINKDKCKKVIIGAAEQSGRLDVPVLHETTYLHNLIDFVKEVKWYAAIEKQNSTTVNIEKNQCGFIIGPEGGFSEKEKVLLLSSFETIKLSDNILRSETAAIVCAALAF